MLLVIALVLILIIAGSSYEVYRFNAPSAATYSKGTVVSVVDANGDVVNVTEPVTRIVCIDDYSSEIICALGCENRIVGEDSTANFPSSVTAIPSVGQTYRPSVEQILELQPDLVVSDGPLNYYDNQTLSQIEAAGIPVYLSNSLNPVPNPYSNETIIDTTCSLITQLGIILNEQANATKIVNYMQTYNNLVKDRIATLTASQEPTVYFEWYFEWETEPAPWIAQAGGINIAANESNFISTLSPEYVTQANPDAIIDMISSTGHNQTDFMTARDELMGRPALQDTTAVKEGNVYVIDGTIYGGISCLQGYLQMGKVASP